MAPSYANLFMAKLESSLLSHPTTLKPLVWWRYIDDIFALWTHGEEALKEFIDDLNTAHSTIKFTSEWSHVQIHFLDVLVSLKDGVLSTDLYTKETDTHQYLHASSCHPWHCKAAIPYSQALRIRRICSSDNAFRRHLDNLHSHLVHRGYESSFIKQQLRHIHSIRRTDLLTSRSMREPSTRVPLVTTFHPHLLKLLRLTETHLPLLHASSRLKQAFPEKPIIVYRRPKNLRDLLVNASLQSSHLQEATGSSPCGSKRCLTRQHIRSGTTIQSTSTGRTFNVRATADCRTCTVVYLIECTLCHLQYVGETQNPLHIRLNGHRSDIKHHLDKPAANHFNSPDHHITHLSIMVLEVMRSRSVDLRRRRESFWIFQLQSLHLGGLNLDP